MSTPSAVELAQHEIESLTSPLRDLVRGFDEQIQTKQLELDELKDARKRAAAMLRLADPTFEPPKKYATKTSSKTKTHLTQDASEGSIEAIAGWLEARRAEFEREPFCISSLVRHAEWNGVGSQATAGRVLAALYERNVIELDHVGTGGAKWYVLGAKG
jgi:hypothetical protein